MPLPVLREELALFTGPALSDGQPSWTLHDPVRNQFFRIDWMSFEIISRWWHGDSQAIAEAVNCSTTLNADAQDVEAVARFLVDNQLVQARGAGSSARQFAERLARGRGSWKTWLLHHYLFFRIPLLRPDRFLDRWLSLVAPLYSRGFARLTLLALLVGGFEVYRDWGRFSTTLLDTFTWNGLAAYGLTLLGVKLLHELGHAFTAKRYGCRVPTMGVALLVMFPVAYTDTNEVWKLAKRHQRLAVAAAGVLTELIIAVWATLAWVLLPEGVPKSVAFLLATTTWVTTLAVNASPFMRFDGYFLLSDWLDMPNLHQRAFALARWDLRERLFGLGAAPPELFPARRRLGLIAFAYATWLYRLLVFLGIAALVYAFFIKAVGVLLFIVEIAWFVVLPVWSEVKMWPGLLRSAASAAGSAPARRTRARRSAGLGLLLVALVLVPWPTRSTSSGLLKPVEVFPVHAPAGAQLVALPWADGARVSAGQTLMELSSPELRLRWARAQAQLAQVRWESNAAGVNVDQRNNLQTLAQRERTAHAELDSVRAEMSLYVPTAPFDGVLRDVEPELKPGVWVSSRERLALLVKDGAWQVETYLDEDAVRRIAVGDTARFFTDGFSGPTLHLTVTSIDSDATRALRDGQLASAFGGSVATRDKDGLWVPERAVYRVTLKGDNSLGSLASQSWRGRVVIDGRWESPALIFLRSALVVMWRELGF